MEHTTGLDELLAGFVAGTLAEPARVLVDSHLELSSRNRDYVRSLEALGGMSLEDAPPVSLEDRDGRLEAIFAAPEASPAASERPVREPSVDPRIPASLRRLIGGRSLDALPWRSRMPGVKECRLGEIDGCSASLLWIRAGRAVPSHTHEGRELTLVLQGGFSDCDGHYERGDIAIADDDIDHKPIADEGEDCICFAVTEGHLRLTGPVGRFFAPFVRG
ncbi:ChrR family anti-sigma-E factor [Polymorphum gilvum]|uniref:Transcriptional activator (Anti-sigma factor) protein n=1 Tax=Polymorphum gilvum (strain LMG 25793 / CGMCC 1.9160 / SL003B-26A1) TaxID=991905 RepID=F2IXC3_POLGS|nr:ChrR family anti-sigma-E factor [Polymorphum gilvum]ADZ70441.1 Transcriptional activator (Anti-sigma factor) protein [Polymorphum gilvum SL003B-26A1]